MKKINTSVKLIFNVKHRPALARAIYDRLTHLGFLPRKPFENSMNISTNWDGHGIRCGGCSSDSIIFAEHQEMTLPDLYDIEVTETRLLVLDGKEVEISLKSFEAIKAALDL